MNVVTTEYHLKPEHAIFAREYATHQDPSFAYQRAYPKASKRTATVNGSKLLRHPAVMRKLSELNSELANTYTPKVIRREFAYLYENTRSDLIKARCLENLAKFEGMMIEKTVNINANYDKLPDLSGIPIDQLEQEFVRRMKLESTGVETFAQLTQNTPVIERGSRMGHDQGNPILRAIHEMDRARSEPAIELDAEGGGVCNETVGGGGQ